jgi:hydroxymethylpyrimidine/phosphomethylpyrimidine kinase
VKYAAKGRPTVLVAAGLEGNGRAGLLADACAVHAAGGIPRGCATAVTAQGRRFGLLRVPGRLLSLQLDASLAFGPPAAAKVGMVPDAGSLAVLWPVLSRLRIPVVVDPVVRTSRGEVLSRLSPRDFLRLAGPGVWLTPNVGELAWLLGQRRVPRRLEEVTALALVLLAEGFSAVVVKGGHLPGLPTDVLLRPEGVVHLVGRRLARSPDRRGSGCRFSSTLATGLALGRDGVEAARDAKRAVRHYLQGKSPPEGVSRPGPGSRSA